MFRLFTLAFMLLLLALTPAEAKRVAVVIGNNAYPNLPVFRQLKKAVNDARAMRDTLRDDLGFVVSFAENADFRAMNNGFKNFEAGVEPGDVVFLFFSGHGVSIGGENFLLPSDIPRPVQGEEQRLIGSSFGAEQLVLRLKKRGARAIFAVLDACRDNPFESETGKAVGGPSGLTKMDAAEGVFILLAAGVRQEALDRLYDADPNPNSLFTRSLIPALKTAGLSQVDLAKRVYKEVKAAAATIGHDQTPAYYDQIDGYVMLKEGEAVKDEEPPITNTAAAEWTLVQKSSSKVVLEAFRNKYGGDALYSGLAEEKLALLDKTIASQISSNENYEFTVRGEEDLRLLVTGFARDGSKIFELKTSRPEKSEDGIIYVVRVNESLFEYKKLAMWCVHDLARKWHLRPKDRPDFAMCDDDPLDTAGTYEFKPRVQKNILENIRQSPVAQDQKKILQLKDKKSEIAKGGTDGEFVFPFPGLIVSWEIFFRFSTKCENDHFAALTSPTGRRLVVMNRGLNRCSGVTETFTSSNKNEVAVFLGSQAKGVWKFEMTDLDKNKYTGKLKSFWMKLRVRNNGQFKDHLVKLSGLPLEIPLKN